MTARVTESASDRPVRVRIAPSPTGEPHVGMARTALWTWLYARRMGGQFILRVEDTDQSRSTEGALEHQMEALRWLGLDWDEGPDIGGPHAPYVQSQRLPGYQSAAARLLESGDAYRCFCSPERLSALRKAQQKAKRPPGYDGTCRNIDPAKADSRADGGESHVVRFHVPDEGTTTFNDLLRGDITVNNGTLDDFVILKSDGFPTYHLAHAVDDPAMGITHVTRGDEWLPSAPRHVLLFDALGEPRPIYVHFPVILGPDGGKLSKRHGAKSVIEYANEGYLPDALFNFLAITGWALDDHTEIFTRERLIEVFDLADVSVNPAGFDGQKLEWMNGLYLREMPEAELSELFAQRLERELPADVPRPLDRMFVESFTPLIRERVKLLSEVADMTGFFFQPEVPTPPAEEILTKKWRDRAEDAADALAAAVADLEALDGWVAAPLEAALRATAERIEARPGDLFMLLRVIVTGRSVTPPLFETMEIVGEEPCLDRLRAAEAMLRDLG